MINFKNEIISWEPNLNALGGLDKGESLKNKSLSN